MEKEQHDTNEQKILEMIKLDLDDKFIAEQLGISKHTVNAYRTKLEKLKLI